MCGRFALFSKENIRFKFNVNIEPNFNISPNQIVTRCVFIANGYFEWKKDKGKKLPFYHFLDDKLLFFGGIYDDTGCCVVTMKSFKYLSSIHHRQPFFLQENQINCWLERKKMKYTYNNIINFHRVSDSVNKIWNNSQELVKEVYY